MDTQNKLKPTNTTWWIRKIKNRFWFLHRKRFACDCNMCVCAWVSERGIFGIRQVKIYSQAKIIWTISGQIDRAKNHWKYDIPLDWQHTQHIYTFPIRTVTKISHNVCVYTHTHCVYFHFSSFISILFLIRFSSISFVVQEIECNATTKSISIESSSKCITSIMYSCIDYTDTTTLLPDSISSVWLRANERATDGVCAWVCFVIIVGVVQYK